MADVNIRKYNNGTPRQLHFKGRASMCKSEKEDPIVTYLHCSIGAEHSTKGLLQAYRNEFFSDGQYNPIGPIEGVEINVKEDGSDTKKVNGGSLYSKLLHLILLADEKMMQRGVREGYFIINLADEPPSYSQPSVLTRIRLEKTKSKGDTLEEELDLEFK